MADAHRDQANELSIQAVGDPATPKPTDFFLSHSSKEKEVVEQLAEGLLEEHGLHCWIDIWAIRAASDWEVEIRKGLQNSRGCLVILGVHGWGPYHRREAELTLRWREENPGYVVVPVLLPGAREEDMEVFPALFARPHRVAYDPAEGEPESLHRIASALGAGAPFPLGRPRLSPYVIRRDARRWAIPPRGARDESVLYRGQALRDAQRLSLDFPGQFDSVALAFLRASEHAEVLRLERSRTRFAYAALILAVLSCGLAILQYNLTQRTREARANGLASLAETLRAEDPTRAIRVAELAFDLDSDAPAARKALLSIFYDDVLYSTPFTATHPLRALGIAPDGERLAFGGYGPTVRITDVDGNQLAAIDGGYDHVTDVVFSPDGDHILVGSYGKGAALYDGRGTLVETFTEASEPIFAVAFAPDGDSVFTGGLSGDVVQWALDGQAKRTYGRVSSNVQSLSLSQDGSYLVAGFFTGEAAVWSIDDGTLQGTIEPGSRPGSARGVALTRHGVVTAHDDGTVLFWDVPSGGSSVKDPSRVLDAHDGTIWSLAVSPSGDSFATASSDSTAKVWTTPRRGARSRSSPELLGVLRGNRNWASDVAFEPDGRNVVVAGMDGSVRRYALVREWPRDLTPGRPSYHYFGDFTPDGGAVLTNVAGGIGLLDLAGGAGATWAAPDPQGPARDAAFLPDGRLISADHDGKVRLYQNHRLERELGGDIASPMTAVCFLPLANTVIAGNRDGFVYGWHPDGSTVFLLEAHRDEKGDLLPVNRLACAPDGGGFAVAFGGYWRGEQRVEVRDWYGRLLLPPLRGQAPRVAGLAHDARGRDLLVGDNGLVAIASAGASHTYAAHLLDRLGAPLRIYAGHHEQVNTVAVRARDVLVGFGLANTSIGGFRVWDERGSLLFERLGESPVVDTALSPDGRHFLTVEDRELRLWLTPSGIREWLRRAAISQLPSEDVEALTSSGAFAAPVPDRSSTAASSR